MDLRNSFEAMAEDINNQLEAAEKESPNGSGSPSESVAVRIEKSDNGMSASTSRNDESLEAIAEEYGKTRPIC